MLPYRPHPLLRNGHLQTVGVGLFAGYRPPRNARTLEVLLPDGERLVVHEELGAPVSRDAPLVILVHGLGGDHSSPYLERIAQRLRQRNRQVWRVDLRGSGHGFELAWRPAHAGSSHDLAAVLARARQEYPTRPIYLVGFSLSGNIVLKLLGELALGGLHEITLEEARIGQALAVAPPIDLNDCADNLDRWSRWPYTRFYVRLLERQAALKRGRWPEWQRLPTLPAIRTIRQFDDRYTAPLGGFRDTRHYYHEASSIHVLGHVSTPTHILLDRHDPIVTWHSHLKARYDPRHVHIQHTSHGGHMGYFGIDDQGRLIRWLEYYVVERMAAWTS